MKNQKEPGVKKMDLFTRMENGYEPTQFEILKEVLKKLEEHKDHQGKALEEQGKALKDLGKAFKALEDHQGKALEKQGKALEEIPD